MKKILLTVALVLGIGLLCAPLSMAQVTATKSYDITVDVPDATGINIAAVKVTGGTFGTTTVDAFDFGFASADYNSTFGIWLPNYYYSIDVGLTGGGGTTDITLTYVEGASPSGQPSDGTLGYKTVATFFSVTGGPAPTDQVTALLNVPTLGTKTLLKNLIGGKAVAGSSLGGGFFRMSVGIYDGNDTSLTTDGGSPFTNADLSGPYSGTLTISATAV